MPAESTGSAPSRQSLEEVLLAYLKAADLPLWPGADGLTIRAVLMIYPLAMAAGRVPGRKELLRKHPNLREDLEAFFGEQPGDVNRSIG
jgi:hypothetical protein